MSILDDAATHLRGILAPGQCLLCRGGNEAGDGLLCAGCRKDLPWNTPACPRCAIPQSSGTLCGDCQTRPPAFDTAWVAFRHATPVRESVLALKYRAGFLHARLLGEEMARAIARHNAALPDCLLPVPLHASKLRRRGYNQALELARVLGRELRIPVKARGARRLRATTDQIGTDAAARRRNVRGAFAVSWNVSGRRLALVDDVMTTGSTLAELARACTKAGAASVAVWVAARAG